MEQEKKKKTKKKPARGPESIPRPFDASKDYLMQEMFYNG
jgi:hypothetical protein